jgi:photosystem II stability/assembly factor-like uncharacterized protein
MPTHFSRSFFVSLILIAALLGLTGVVLANASPLAFYWYSTSTGLPTNADVEALAFSPTVSRTLYVGTFGDGVYRSTDHGANWTAINTGITLPMHIQNGLTVHPLSSTLVFAGDYYGDGLYRSANSGNSWSLVLPDTSIRAVVGSPITPGLVLAGDRYAGAYRSLNWGSTWASISQTAGLTDTNVNVITFRSTAPYTAYLGTAQSIFVSRDGGSTWQYRSDLPSAIFALKPMPTTPTKLFAGTFNDGVYTSTNDGLTWSPANTGLPTNEWITSLAFDPFTPTIVYAGAWSGQVYRSENSGASWTGLGYLGNVYALATHPAARNVIYAGTSNNGLFRGSTLDHISIDPISATQYVYRPFTLTITARDALGFLLNSASSAEMHALTPHDTQLAATLSIGYNGTIGLTDTAKLVSPTSLNLVNGSATSSIVFKQTIVSDRITATLQLAGLSAIGNPFKVKWFAQTYLPIVLK